MEPRSLTPGGRVAYPYAVITDLDRVVELVREGDLLVLSGAGLSTESGIPDYRGPTGRQRESSPIQYREYVSSAEARRRYWARSAVGWPFVRAAQPNAGHRAVAAMEHAGLVHGVITQNVDGLHHVAGSRAVVELHGSLASVVCLSCGTSESRDQLQQRMIRANPGWDL
ncbi:MAG: NAD-dependent protein deacetylase 1, partial [Spirochaetaceae bacterium]